MNELKKMFLLLPSPGPLLQSTAWKSKMADEGQKENTSELPKCQIELTEKIQAQATSEEKSSSNSAAKEAKSKSTAIL